MPASGTASARRRAAVRIGSAIVLALLAACGLVVAAPGPSAYAQTPQLRTTLTTITPMVTSGTREIRATGTVKNTGKVTLSAVKASFWISTSPITTREQLGVAAGSDPDTREGRRVADPVNLVADVAPSLKPGATGRFTLTIPVSTLQKEYGVDSGGIYVAGVDVRGLAPGAYIRDTWRLRTFMPWIPAKTKLTPVEVAYLVPLTGPPDLLDNENDVLLDRSHADLFAPNGRLSHLLDLGAKYDLDYLVDPAILEQAEAMQNGYHLPGQESGPKEQAGVQDARAFYDKARGLLTAHDTLMLPYADPDLPALQRNRLADRFGAAMNASAAAGKAYGTTGTTIAWPGNGYADAGMLETIAESGGRTVLLSQGSLPSLPTDGSSPVVSLVTPSDQQTASLTGLVADQAVTGGGPGEDHAALQTRQRFLSETALLAMRSGSASTLRRVVAAFPRTWDPGTGEDNLLATARHTPWLRQISASALLSQAPVAYGGPLRYPSAERAKELRPSVIEQLRGLDSESSIYLDLLADPGKEKDALSRAFLRGASMAWRQDPARGVDLTSRITSDLEVETTTNVGVIAPQIVTLSSDSGRFPVTIDNRLQQPIRVRLEATSRDPAHLKIEQAAPVTVDRLRRATIPLTADTRGGGAIEVGLQLRTVDGNRPIGGTALLQVRVTGYGTVGWVVIAVGAGLLFVAAGFKVVRRIRDGLAGRRERARGPDTTADHAAEPTEPTEPTGPTEPAGLTEPAESAETKGPDGSTRDADPADGTPGTSETARAKR